MKKGAGSDACALCFVWLRANDILIFPVITVFEAPRLNQSLRD